MVHFRNTDGCGKDFLLTVISLVVLAFTNLTLTIIINKNIDKVHYQLLSGDRSDEIEEIKDQKKQLNIKKRQISILSVGLFIYATFFLVVMILAQLMVFDSNAFE